MHRLWLVLAAATAAFAQERPELVVPTGHSDTIRGIAWSPDGRYVATGSDDRTIIVWDLAGGRQRRRLFGHAAAVTAVAWSFDGHILASGSDDRRVRLWDAATGRPRGEPLGGHTAGVTCVAFSPDGRMLASGSDDNTVRLWDVDTGRPRGEPLEGDSESKFAGVTCVAFSPDGQTLAAGSSFYRESRVRLWDAATGQPRGEPLRARGDGVTCLAFSPDGRTLAAGSTDATVRLWAVATGAAEGGPLTGHTKQVISVAFSADGSTVVSGSTDNTVRRWDAANGQRADAPLDKLAGDVTSMALSPDGRTLAWGCGDPIEGQAVELWLYDALGGQPKGDPFVGHATAVWSVAFAPNSRTLASGGRDRTVRLWDVATGRPVGQPFEGHQRPVTTVAFAPDGRTLASGGYDGTVRLWDVATGAAEGKWGAGEVSCLAFTPDGSGLLWNRWGYNLEMVDLASRRDLEQPFTGDQPTRYAMAISPDGRKMACDDSDGPVTLWDLAPGGGKHQLTGHTAQVLSVAFSPDGQTLATGGEDQTIRLWNVADGAQIGVLVGHTGAVWTLAFSPDGHRLASGSVDGELRLWNLAAGAQTGFLAPHAGAIWSVAFSPDGRTLACGCELGPIFLCDPATAGLRAAIYSLDAGRNDLCVTPQGYYSGSLDGEALIRWRVGDQFFPPESYEDRFRRPDLVAKALRGDTLPADATGNDTVHAPPEVAVTVEGGSGVIDGDQVPLRITVKPAPAARIKRVELIINGRVADLQRTRDMTAQGAGGPLDFGGRDITVEPGAGADAAGTLVLRGSVPLLPGEDTAHLSAAATDSADLRGTSPQVTVRRRRASAETRPNLWLLAVGVSQYATPQYDLHFADADATALAATFERQRGRAFEQVHTKVITNAQATRDGLRAGLRWLRDGPGRDDVAMVLFAGHGVRGNLGRLFFCTHEADLDDLKDTCVPWEEVDEALRSCGARQVLMFLDCCHAGAFGERQATADELAKRLGGVLVFAASKGDQHSQERPEWGHGAFTSKVLEALGGKADGLGRGYVTVAGLVDFVAGEVKDLTDGQQTPWLPRAEQFDTQLVLARLR